MRSVYLDEQVFCPPLYCLFYNFSDIFQSQTVFTGGEDGLVRAWKPSDNEDTQGSGSSTKTPKKEKGKEKGKGGGRYKPY